MQQPPTGATAAQQAPSAKHTTFTGPLAARMDRVIDRWLRLANRRAIGIDRGRQLCARLDLAMSIAERFASAPA